MNSSMSRVEHRGAGAAPPFPPLHAGTEARGLERKWIAGCQVPFKYRASVFCSEDLPSLVARLCLPGVPRKWSLCIHGPPGTGKSLFARHLASRLGLEVMQRRASDLLSMWVGGTEKQIADAFAAAK